MDFACNRLTCLLDLQIINQPTAIIGNTESITPKVREEIMSHLEMVSESFGEYFATGDLEISVEWIINPYS